MPDEPIAPTKGLTLTDNILSRLARECARDLYPPAAIREQFKLTIDEWDDATNSAFFQTRLAEEVSQWNDPGNATVRISAKAATLIEESLPEIYALIHDRTQPMAAKVQALQAAARWANIGNDTGLTADGNADRKVRITINIDGRSIQFDKEKAKVVDAEVVSLTQGGNDGQREANGANRPWRAE